MSPASYALRFAAGFDEMMMALSGMSDMAQMQDNLSFMKDFNHYLQKNKKQLNKSQKSSKVKTLFHVLLVVTVWKNAQRTLLFQIDLPV